MFFLTTGGGGGERGTVLGFSGQRLVHERIFEHGFRL